MKTGPQFAHSFTLGLLIAMMGAAGWWLADPKLESGELEQAHSNLAFGKDWRNPAAIRQSFDFSRLQGKDLLRAGRQRLLDDVRVIRASGRIGIELGHFVVKGEHGSKQFACEHYDRLSLVFLAEGMAENGRVPRLNVEAPCSMSSDINRMQPVWVPVSQFLMGTPQDFRTFFSEKEGTHFRLKNTGQIWPRQWRLQEIKLFHQSKSDRSLLVIPTRGTQKQFESLKMFW